MRHATPRKFRRHSWSIDELSWKKGVRAGESGALFFFEVGSESNPMDMIYRWIWCDRGLLAEKAK